LICKIVKHILTEQSIY